MRAVVFREFGAPEVLGEEVIAVPVPAPGEVLVQVAAVSVGRFLDLTARAGQHPYRGFTFPHVLGAEHAGVGALLGPDVTGLTGAASGLGSLTAGLVRHLGGRVIGTSRSAAKRARLAAELGVSAALDAADPGFAATVRELTAGRGADIVVDNLGDPRVWAASLASLAPGDPGQLGRVPRPAGAGRPVPAVPERAAHRRRAHR
jgi:NADPH:quinone reductase-like Zn-dependent oxidoreductase